MAEQSNSLRESLEQSEAQEQAGNACCSSECRQTGSEAKRGKGARGLLHERAKQAFRFEMPPDED